MSRLPTGARSAVTDYAACAMHSTHPIAQRVGYLLEHSTLETEGMTTRVRIPRATPASSACQPMSVLSLSCLPPTLPPYLGDRAGLRFTISLQITGNGRGLYTSGLPPIERFSLVLANSPLCPKISIGSPKNPQKTYLTDTRVSVYWDTDTRVT